MTTREEDNYIELELTDLELTGLEPTEPQLTEPELDPLLATGRQPAGYIVHDARGNAVWKWFGDDSTTDYTIDYTSPVLENFDPLDLQVEGQDGDSGRSMVFDAGGGYDPYNRGKR